MLTAIWVIESIDNFPMWIAIMRGIIEDNPLIDPTIIFKLIYFIRIYGVKMFPTIFTLQTINRNFIITLTVHRVV